MKSDVASSAAGSLWAEVQEGTQALASYSLSRRRRRGVGERNEQFMDSDCAFFVSRGCTLAAKNTSTTPEQPRQVGNVLTRN